MKTWDYSRVIVYPIFAIGYTWMRMNIDSKDFGIGLIYDKQYTPVILPNLGVFLSWIMIGCIFLVVFLDLCSLVLYVLPNKYGDKIKSYLKTMPQRMWKAYQGKV